MRILHFIAALVLLGLTLGFPGVSRADTKMDVEVGWGWRPRADRWTPVFVTASCDDKTRNVVLNVEWPEGGKYLMHVAQAMTINSHKRTFPLLLPVHGWDYQQAVFTLSDRDSGKTLAHFPEEGDQAVSYFGGYPDASASFVGVSGASSTLGSLQTSINGINIGFLPTRRLPTSPLGFDSLDVLILNAPNLGTANANSAAMDEDQQQAVVDWVRAGGKLILWPGDSGFPASGPLSAVLPGKVGLRQDVALSPADLSALGLSPRFKNLPAFPIEPAANAQGVPMLNSGQLSAYRGHLGLGTIVLSPVNVAELQFNDDTHGRTVWRPLIKGLIAIPGEPANPAATPDTGSPQPPPAVSNYYPNGNTDDAREKSAEMQLANFLGDVPGAGQIGFSYIAIVLFGMMLVVGPVDWFVLKKLGRQPWTWVTTSGWIALVTLGALSAGYLFKSGDLHYRTVRTIDQAGGATVASTDYVALYSSRTREYQMKTDPNGWWQPSGLNEYGRSGMKLDMDFHQTGEGNSPEAMIVNVWSLRFLRGDHLAAGPAVLSADLRLEMPASHKSARVVGSIRNLSSLSLKNVRIMTRHGAAKLAGGTSSATTTPASTSLLPQASLGVDAALVAEAAATLSPQDPSYRYRYEPSGQTPGESDLWRVAADLNARRGNEMSAKVATGKFAIIYAEAENPPAAAELMGQKGLEQHRQFIRALVDLHDQEGK